MSTDTDLSHVDKGGRARMVDVGGKAPTERVARAEAYVVLGDVVAQRLARDGVLDKGNVLDTARIAGILAAKKTAELIPMCHVLPLDAVELDTELKGDTLRIEARVRTHARTGVEMEALTAAAVAALTVYDMCKSMAKGIEIGPVRLLEKRGGASGTWPSPEEDRGR